MTYIIANVCAVVVVDQVVQPPLAYNLLELSQTIVKVKLTLCNQKRLAQFTQLQWAIGAAEHGKSSTDHAVAFASWYLHILAFLVDDWWFIHEQLPLEVSIFDNGELLVSAVVTYLGLQDIDLSVGRGTAEHECLVFGNINTIDSAEGSFRIVRCWSLSLVDCATISARKSLVAVVMESRGRHCSHIIIACRRLLGILG